MLTDMLAKRIFISHSSKTQTAQEALAELVQCLEESGCSVWYDEKLNEYGGQDWWNPILTKLRESDIFVFALTPESVKSYACELEFLYADSIGKLILPVMLESINVELLPLKLSHTQIVHFLPSNPERAKYLKRSLGKLNKNEIEPRLSRPDARIPEPPMRNSPLVDLREQIAQPTLSVDEQFQILGVFDALLASDKGVEVNNTLTFLERFRAHPRLDHEIVLAIEQKLDRFRRGATLVKRRTLPRYILLGTLPILILFIIGTMLRSSRDDVSAKIQDAENGVTQNAAWTPYIKELNGIQMALVPKGCFPMGSADGNPDEMPVHKVCLAKPFWLAVYEVTQAQFVRLDGQAVQPSHFAGDNLPREQITWTEAADFCQKHNLRLPTEAEWEYAARGPDGHKYPWGNEFVPNNVVSSATRAWEVGSKPGGKSWIGAYDMSGNVWEWVNDWYSETYYGTVVDGAVNPTGPASGDARVLRGGSWFYLDDSTTATVRDKDAPDHGRSNSGFRCARDVFTQG